MLSRLPKGGVRFRAATLLLLLSSWVAPAILLGETAFADSEDCGSAPTCQAACCKAHTASCCASRSRKSETLKVNSANSVNGSDRLQAPVASQKCPCDDPAAIAAGRLAQPIAQSDSARQPSFRRSSTSGFPPNRLCYKSTAHSSRNPRAPPSPA